MCAIPHKPFHYLVDRYKNGSSHNHSSTRERYAITRLTEAAQNNYKLHIILGVDYRV